VRRTAHDGGGGARRNEKSPPTAFADTRRSGPVVRHGVDWRFERLRNSRQRNDNSPVARIHFGPDLRHGGLGGNSGTTARPYWPKSSRKDLKLLRRSQDLTWVPEKLALPQLQRK